MMFLLLRHHALTGPSSNANKIKGMSSKKMFYFRGNKICMHSKLRERSQYYEACTASTLSPWFLSSDKNYFRQTFFWRKIMDSQLSHSLLNVQMGATEDDISQTWRLSVKLNNAATQNLRFGKEAIQTNTKIGIAFLKYIDLSTWINISFKSNYLSAISC